MDLNALRNADFKLLDDAVEDWASIVRNLDALSKDAEDGLHKAANKAEWAGVNSQVTREFIGKTAGEIKDAHTQAASIHGVLSDTAGELRGCQTRLNEAITNGLKKNLTVLDTGNGSFTVTMNVHPDRAAAGYTPPSHTETDVTALRDEVQGILRQATESDNSANEILTALADQTNYGFGEVSYKDRDQAAAALKEAAELAALAKKKPGDLTVADFERLNAGLAKYANDPLFAEKFATTLGPKGTLEFWAGLNDPHASARLGSERVDKYDDLQRNLSMTLAQATQVDTADMASWKGQMIRLGDQQIGDWHSVTGFKVMSNLMRAGDYDDDFLKSYGTALMSTERRLTGNGDHPNMAWRQMGMDPLLNRMGDDSGHDPLTGYLKALANSPEAATDFFNDPYVSKDDSPFERDTDGNGKKGKVGLSNFQYLFEERDWPEADEQTLDGDDVITGRNNLAQALEAATTGHPAGELPTADTPPHTAEQAKLMESLVASIGDDPERLTSRGYMGDSVGQITSEYLPDINRSVSDANRNDPDSTVWPEVQKMYPTNGAEAVLDHRDVTKLLFAVGQSPDGYAAVEVGQKAYMSRLMEYHLNPDLPAELVVDDSTERVVRDIAERSGQISGTLGLGAQQELGDPAKEKDEEYQNSMDIMKSNISGGLGIATGVGTSFIATPWVGAVVGGGVSAVTGSVLESVFQDFESTQLEGTSDEMGNRWQSGLVNTGDHSGQAARLAAQEHGMVAANDAENWARSSGRQGYYNAKLVLEGQAPGSMATG